MKSKDIGSDNKARLYLFVPISFLLGIALLFVPYIPLKEGTKESTSSFTEQFLISTPGIAIVIITMFYAFKLKRRINRDRMLVSAIEYDDADKLSELLEELDDTEILDTYLIVREKQNAKLDTLIKYSKNHPDEHQSGT